MLFFAGILALFYPNYPRPLLALVLVVPAAIPERSSSLLGFPRPCPSAQQLSSSPPLVPRASRGETGSVGGLCCTLPAWPTHRNKFHPPTLPLTHFCPRDHPLRIGKQPRRLSLLSISLSFSSLSSFSSCSVASSRPLLSRTPCPRSRGKLGGKKVHGWTFRPPSQMNIN